MRVCGEQSPAHAERYKETCIAVRTAVGYVSDIQSPEDEMRHQAVELYRASNLSTSEIAKRMGVSRSTLYSWLERAGVVGQRKNRTTIAADLAELVSVEDEHWREENDRWNRMSSLIEDLQTEIRNRREANLNLIGEVKALIHQHFLAQEERGRSIMRSLDTLSEDLETARTERSALNATVSRLEGLVEGLAVAVQALAIGIKTTPEQPEQQ